MLYIKRSLPLSDKAIGDYIASWRRLLDVSSSFSAGWRPPASRSESSPKRLEAHEVQRQLFDHMYNNLNILDGKANSLIQLSGILVAAYSVVATAEGFNPDARILFVAGAVYAAVAVFLCLRVVWLHWSSRTDLDNGVEHMKGLIRVRNTRTIQYRRAWTFALLSLVLLIALLLDLKIRVWGTISATVPLDEMIALGVAAHLFAVYVYDDIVLMLRRGAPDNGWLARQVD
jgi:hypothetical protein